MQMVPVLLSLLVLGAHFFRGFQWPLLGACLVLIVLAWVRRPWAARIVQAGLLLGSLEWARTLYGIAVRRAGQGEPWVRMAVILGGVALFTAGSALLFLTKGMRRRYRLGPGHATGATGATDDPRRT